jgi:hypothetical protein
MDSKNQKSNQKVPIQKSNSKNVIPDTNIFYLVPIIFIIAILPFIVRLKEYETPLSDYPWFSSTNQFVDFFLYYKQWTFICISFIMALIIIIRGYVSRKTLRFSPIFIPLAVYAGLAFISSVFSKNKNYSFTGIFEQFESIFVLLGYCLVVYYIYLFVNTERDVILILNSLLISVIILGILGLMQFLGHDFFKMQTGLKLITPNLYWNALDTFSFNFDAKRVYLTLYNPNYVGVYVSLILPILFILMFFLKKLWLFPVYLLAIAGMIVSLVGSRSTTGIVGIIIAAFITLIFLRRYLLKYFYISIPLFIIVIVALFFFNGKFDNSLIYNMNKVLNIQKSLPNLTDIQTNDDELVIKYKGNALRVKFSVDNMNNCYFDFLDEENNALPVSMEALNGPITILDERFPGFVFTPIMYDDVLSFIILIDEHEWYFTNQTDDGTYYYINQYGRLDKIKTAPSVLFTGYEDYATGRGYIWSRSIPLLKNNIILGSGADTFALEFPHQDYVNLYNFGYDTQFLSKPHSLYLQVGVQTGVISLLAFLIFYGMYFISSIRIYLKGYFNNYYSKVGVSIFIGTISYMICSISNDSTITVAPVFWVLIGLGIAVNSKVKLIIHEEVSNIE